MHRTRPSVSLNRVWSIAWAVGLLAAVPVFGQIEKLRRDYQSPDPVQRMQALISASELTGGDVAELCVPALSDTHPSVRYWAAKAIAEVSARAGDNSPFSRAQQGTILEAISARLPGEDSSLVAQQMYRAMVSLKVPEARPAMIRAMNQRLARHVGQISDEIRAEIAGLVVLAKAIVTDHFGGRNVDVELRQSAPMMGKYLLVIATGLKDSKLSDELKPSAASAVGAIEQVFKVAVDRFVRPKPDNLQPLQEPVNADDYLKLLLNALSWIGDDGVLIKHGIVEKREDLKLPAPAAP